MLNARALDTMMHSQKSFIKTSLLARACHLAHTGLQPAEGHQDHPTGTVETLLSVSRGDAQHGAEQMP